MESKVFSLRIAVDLYDQIKAIAKADDRSVNYIIVKAIEKFIADSK